MQHVGVKPAKPGEHSFGFRDAGGEGLRDAAGNTACGGVQDLRVEPAESGEHMLDLGDTDRESQ